jgi:hypothetical protein
LKGATRTGFGVYSPIIQSFLTLLFPYCLPAQQPAPPSSPNSPVIKTNVNEVLVSVVVRDAHGVPVGIWRKTTFTSLIMASHKSSPDSRF